MALSQKEREAEGRILAYVGLVRYAWGLLEGRDYLNYPKFPWKGYR